MKLTTLLLLIPLGACATLGIPTPWHSTEGVTEIADTVAAERDAVLVTAIEADLGELPSLEVPPAYEAPEPSGGPSWGDRLFELAVIVLGGGGAGAALTRLLRGPGERKVKVARKKRAEVKAEESAPTT